MVFQENAWCDESVMIDWIKQQWEPACEGNTLLVLDAHKAQKTETVLSLFKKGNTDTVIVPAGIYQLATSTFEFVNVFWAFYGCYISSATT